MQPAWPYPVTVILGATGTFGHAITRYLLDTYPDVTLRLLSRDEMKQAAMARLFPEPRIRFFLGDVRDLARLNLACAGADLVIHAAALKQVDRGEYDPEEFCKTNIGGTQNVIRACRTMGVTQAIFLSSDKSVAPVNLYGATKMVSEKLWIQANQYAPHGTRYSVCRYGNVMGSRGSVIETWRAALAAGQPLRVTDMGMTRFWMAVQDAVTLVNWVAQHGLRGGVVVPHLPAFHVIDLAEALDTAHVDAWTITGRRPGEKVHEVLMTPDEMARATWYGPSAEVPVYYVVPPVLQTWGASEPQAMWAVPPRDTVWGPVAASAPAYESGTWPWRLGVEDVQTRVRHL